MSAVDQQFLDGMDLNRGMPTDPDLWSTVVEDVLEYAGDESVVYFKTSQLDSGISRDVAGRCLCQLAECDDSPLDIDVWAGENQPPRVYRVVQDTQQEEADDE